MLIMLRLTKKSNNPYHYQFSPYLCYDVISTILKTFKIYITYTLSGIDQKHCNIKRINGCCNKFSENLIIYHKIFNLLVNLVEHFSLYFKIIRIKNT